MGKGKRTHLPIGHRSGRLTVIEGEGIRNKWGKYCYPCICDCGNISFVSGSAIKAGRRKSCCCTSPRSRKLKPVHEGDVFGLVVVVDERFRKDGRYHRHCLCKCGTKFVVRETYLRCNRIKSCGCKSRGAHPNWTPDLSTIWKNYLSNAKRRNIDFRLTGQEFEALVKKPCHYCGQYAVRSNGVNLRGIDRVDSKKGYILENCVSCCGVCNAMKSTKTKDDFLAHIASIYHHSVEPLQKKRTITLFSLAGGGWHSDEDIEKQMTEI